MTDKEIRKIKADLLLSLHETRQERNTLRVALGQVGEHLAKLGKRLSAHSLDYADLSQREAESLNSERLERLLAEHKEAIERERRLEKDAEELGL